MKQRTVCVCAAFFAFAAPRVVDAQTCVGLPDPEGGRLQVGLGLASAEAVNQRLLTVGAVTSTVFVQSTGVVVDHDDRLLSGAVDSLSIGYRLPMGDGKKLEVCPVVAGSWGELNDFVFRTAGAQPVRERVASTRSVAAGLSLGYRLVASDAFTVIPALRASYVNSSTRLEGSESRSSTNYGLVMLSAGLALRERFTVYPVVSVPAGGEGVGASWGVSFTLSFWRAKPKTE